MTGYAQELYHRIYRSKGGDKKPDVLTGEFSARDILLARQLAGPDAELAEIIPLVMAISASARGGVCADAAEVSAALKRHGQPERIVTGEYLVTDHDAVYLRDFYRHERLAADKIRLCLDEDRLHFLTGGPGTGKTTMIRKMVGDKIATGLLPGRIALTAPTGKAARRIGESCAGLYSEYPELKAPFTLHRLLGFNPEYRFLRHNAKNPLPYDLVIVDEASMIDIELVHYLLDALAPDASLLLAGDADQLLSVNAGAVFSDLVALDRNCERLTRVYRQQEGAEGVTALAARVRDKKEIRLADLQGAGLEYASPENLEEAALAWLENHPEGQILVPYNSGENGVDTLNEAVAFRRTGLVERLYDGAPVMATRNFYDIGLFNGETGILQRREEGWQIHSDGRIIALHPLHMSALVLSHAVTVHKSQGSEYTDVCLVLPPREDDVLLDRRILYTGITRAKRSLAVFGSLELINGAVMADEAGRLSRLADRIRGISG